MAWSGMRRATVLKDRPNSKDLYDDATPKQNYLLGPTFLYLVLYAVLFVYNEEGLVW